ncbi:hypothetical protein [Streptomyces sp. BPTC-684]|uniref:hypothetical protein n=1 Tax=Streptomyces sp. BPTC-684 TaxID=3043734 RepID=UPI0024B1C1DD|nr:hypothetical protein [Streptomyces sp. BPTC-684]WHM40596.1 hypothetical protein QIY60_29490 [Streptomyces sp. BPTC-684]
METSLETTDKEEATGTFALPVDGYISSTGHAGGFWLCDVPLHPKDGYTYLEHGALKWVSGGSLSVNIVVNRTDNAGGVPDGTPLPKAPSLSVYVTQGHGKGGEQLQFSITVKYTPTPDKRKEIEDRNAALVKERTLELDRLQRGAYMKAAIERIDAASRVEPRGYDVLCEEERGPQPPGVRPRARRARRPRRPPPSRCADGCPSPSSSRSGASPPVWTSTSWAGPTSRTCSARTTATSPGPPPRPGWAVHWGGSCNSTPTTSATRS